MEQESSKVKIFCSYAHEDKRYFDDLKIHLSALERQNLIDILDDSMIEAGNPREENVKEIMNKAQIILLLISPSFTASKHHYDVEMRYALERRERKGAIVIPIIIRSIDDWQNLGIDNTKLGILSALPQNTKGVIDLDNSDDDWKNVVRKIRRHVNSLSSQPLSIDKFRITRRKILLALCGTGAVCAASSAIAIKNSWNPPQKAKISVSFLHSLEGHNDSVVDVASSPNGQRLVSASWDKTIRLWDVLNYQLIRTFKGHTDRVTSVTWSPNGKHIASGSDDRTVRIWDIETAQCLLILRGHTDHVSSVLWSPDGTRLASGGADHDHTVRVWNTSTGQQLYSRPYNSVICSVAWSNTSQYIASGDANETLQVWNVDNGSLLYPANSVDPIGHFPKLHIAWSHNGKFIAGGGDAKNIHIWDAVSGKKLQDYQGHKLTVINVAWSSDDKYLASGSDDTTFCIWDARNTNESFIIKPLYQSEATSDWKNGVNAVAWLLNNQSLAVGRGGGAYTIDIWKVSM